MAYNDKTPLQKAEYANETKEQLVTSLKSKGFDIKEDNSFREIAGIVADNTTIVDTKDADALASNIDKDKTAYINGTKITGTSEKVDTSDATAARDNIEQYTTAYVNGVKVSGSLQTLKTSSSQYLSFSSVGGARDSEFTARFKNTTKRILYNTAELRCIVPTDKVANAYNLTADKLVSGNKILGIEGTATELKGQTKTVTPTTSQQTITPDTNYNGITEVTINAVDNTIDSNIVAGNIKSGVSILGIAGTYETDLTELEALASDILGETT